MPKPSPNKPLLYFLTAFIVTMIALLTFQECRAAESVNKLYGLTPADTLLLGDRYTYNQAKKKYPKWVGYMEYRGASSTVLRYSEAEAAIMDIQWSNDNGFGKTWYEDGLQSRVAIDVGDLRVMVTAPITLHQGIIFGTGSGQYSQPQYSLVSNGTTFVIRRDKWNGEPGDYAAFRSNNWGREGTYSYHESYGLRDFRIEGGYVQSERYNPAIKESGIQIWRAGETSYIRDIYVTNCNDYGIEFSGGNHATAQISNITSFLHGKGAIGIIGGGQLAAYFVSSDDCPAQFVVARTDKGSMGNGTKLMVFGNKMETGITTNRTVNEGMMLVDADGWFQGVFIGVMYSRVSALPETLVRIKPHPDMPSKIIIQGFTDFYLPKTILHDRSSRIRYQFKGSLFASTINTITWTSVDGLKADGPFDILTETCDEILPPLPLDPNTGKVIGSWNYDKCKDPCAGCK